MADALTDELAGQLLDPFAFHGHPASSIVGLGGAAPLPDPTYAFHSPYVPVARGHAHFVVRFAKLQARRGSLLLRVHMLTDEPGAVAVLVTSHRVQLNWLAHHGGHVQLRFEAFRGARYAIMGVTPDQLDASADALTITLDRPATPDDLAAAGGATEARSTAYRSETIRSAPVPLLRSLEPPSFAQPVSQPYTPQQLNEPAFRARCAGIADLPTDPLERWQTVYGLQALDRYGVLRDGARGLLLGRSNRPVEQAMAVAGAACERVALRLDPPSSGDELVPRIDAVDLPDDLFAFDFLLTIRAADKLGNERAATRFVERAMECLRPGGVAVHLIAHHPNPDKLAHVAFDRNGLERLAFALISNGHQLARLKLGATPSPGGAAIPFGLVARRGSSIR